MSYARPQGASANDFNASRDFELEVGEWLGDYKVPNLTDPNRLDWWVPGFYLDVKEKKQRLTARWHLLPGVPEVELFVLDELAVRKAMRHFPHAYFVIRDVPGGNRIFLARVDEVVAAEHVQANRTGNTGHKKGKWILNLANFRQLFDPASQVRPMILQDQVSMPWKDSQALSQMLVREI